MAIACDEWGRPPVSRATCRAGCTTIEGAMGSPRCWLRGRDADGPAQACDDPDMSLTPDEVRELATRKEGTLLDFKCHDYEWGNSKKAANAELAKDLMAMANALSPGAAPAHILIGVENDGTITGIPRRRPTLSSPK